MCHSVFYLWGFVFCFFLFFKFYIVLLIYCTCVILLIWMCTLTVSVRIRFFFCTTFSLCIWNVCIWKRDIKAKFVYRYMLIIVILLSKKKDVIKDCFLQTCSHMLIIVTLHSKKKRCYQRLIFTNMQSYVIFETIYWFLHQSIYIHIVIFKVKPCKKKKNFQLKMYCQ